MRAAGDSKRPLIFILIGGVVNVILNALFITVFDMTVEGVAIATVVSNGISALLCAITLIKAKGVVNLSVKYLKFFKKEFIEIVKVGVPVGVQSSLLTFSNVLIQSSVNLCGKSAVSGSSYAYQIEMYVYRAMHGISLATTSVVSQNNGAKNYQRIKTAVLYSALTVSVLGISLSVIATALCKPILTLVSGDSAVIDYAVTRMLVACLPYFLCGVMEILSYSLRALGKSMESVVICLFGSFVIITVWITTVFKLYQKYALIFFAYPVSWLVTSALLLVVLLLTFKTLKEKYKNID